MSSNFTNPSSNTNSPATYAEYKQVVKRLSKLNVSRKPTVIGIYGISGSGKTFLLNQLKERLGRECFAFYDGSSMIDSVVPGGLDAFKHLSDEDKKLIRQEAISKIREECLESGKTGVVAGHFMFWESGQNEGQLVCTERDLQVYSHILYLDVDLGVISLRRIRDTKKDRPYLTIPELSQWQQAEKTSLRALCRQHKILFMLIKEEDKMLEKVENLVWDFRVHSEAYNQVAAGVELDDIVLGKSSKGKGDLETVLLLDADRTLNSVDTGAVFWDLVAKKRGLSQGEECPLKTIFSGPSLGYSYTAFRQAVLFYEESTADSEFEALCEEVASSVIIHPEFLSLLQQVANTEHVRGIIVTCGIRLVWQKVLEKVGLAETVKVIGGGRIADGYVVTALVKESLVTHLHEKYGLYVWAFGDSILDLPMLQVADKAIVVVLEEKSRSKSMEEALRKAIKKEKALKGARQALLPGSESASITPRLDAMTLPVVNLGDGEVVASILTRRGNGSERGLKLTHATDTPAALLLMTPTRDSRVSGPALRDAHAKIGSYLATQYLSDPLGLEEYEIPHVQENKKAVGYRIRDQGKTIIIPLMRGGEPMAFGISEVLPLSMFLHAKEPEDVQQKHLKGMQNVILVDSVINSGKSIVEFVKHIRSLCGGSGKVRIVVVASVAQEDAVKEGGYINTQLGNDSKGLEIVALRVSKNKFVGKGW
ncbi:hypothetical protein G7Y89_g13771 [Cudoniella acicularis]|uniref:Phosphoribosyltransferase domain-containing protein n=1 Tax=Cudoniella acicularis TaxID=354080 RepID=A0A8H4RA02_9HELO|nr:hypothetical protein G7Y89_g13771 [Cudoniella acicularis]